MSLATTLMVVSILIFLGLTVVAVSVYSLNVSARLGNVEKARQSAESVISLTIEKILADQAFGVSREPAADTEFRSRAKDSSGSLTFTPGRSGLAYSTNNLSGEVSMPGSGGRVVPPHSAHLIGVGQSGGVWRHVETVVTVPPFPYAIACSGPFESSGDLTLAAVAHRQDLPFRGQALDPNKVLPAHLVSNSRRADAIQLGPDTTISGDLRSAGGILFDATTTQVLGEIVSHGAPLPIPQMDVSRLDPSVQGRSQVAAIPVASARAPAYQGFVRRQGDLTISDGLILDNGVLYVEGDLYVSGGIRGVGAVLASGQIQVVGGSSLSSDDRLALVSGGPMRLTGDGMDSSSFQGLIYSGGGFTADQITLVGALIVQAGEASTILHRTRMIRSPELTRLQVVPSPQTPLTFASAQSPGHSLTIQAGYQGGGYFVQDPGDETTTTDLDVQQAAQKIGSLLSGADLEGAADEADILAQLQALPRTDEASPSQPPYALDPSLFLRLEERLRIVLWEES